MSGSLSESPMPIRSGAIQRPSGCRCGNTLRHRYDEVGLPCSSTIGSPFPTCTYAISRPRTRRRCFWYGNAAEIMFAFLRARPAAAIEADANSNVPSMEHSFRVRGGHYLSWAGSVWLQAHRCRQELPSGSRRVGRIDRQTPELQSTKIAPKVPVWRVRVTQLENEP